MMNAPMLLAHHFPSSGVVACWHRPAPSPAITRRARIIQFPNARSRSAVVATADREALALLLRSGVRVESLPRHVGLVIDGHSRWARARGLSLPEGHAAGFRVLEDTVRLSRAWGIRALTVFLVSPENIMGRPKAEIDFLMQLSEGIIRDNVDEFCRDGIRLHVIGDSQLQPASLLRVAREASQATRSNSEMVLMLAIGYSGRRDMLRACQELATEVQRGLLRPEDIDEALVAGKLATSVAGSELSCPDLIIRTSGELRLSNFLLWQSAYSELYFPDVMWPDFGEGEYLRALRSYQTGQRRFGKRIPCQ